MRILGADPGITNVGYGIIDFENKNLKLVDYGTIKIHKNFTFPEKLNFIYHEFIDIFHKFQPETVVVEKLFVGKNINTALKISEVRGIIILAAYQANSSVFEYSPSKIKQAITGHGSATKREIQKMIKLLLGLEKMPKPMNADAADALAVAICHAHNQKFT